ncbi:MAG: aspartate/glutamate racemase family protein [Fervidicoccaceae archaeon]
MKLLVLNPVSTEIWDEVTSNYVKRYLEPSTSLEIRSLREGPEAIESEYDKALAERYVVEEVMRAEREKFDAVVINCFDDPGLHASREVASIPVFGIGETSLYYALMLGEGIAVISTGKYASISYRKKARELGIESRLVYSAGIELPVLELKKDPRRVKELLHGDIERAINDHRAEVVVLGCGGFIGMAEELSKSFKIPIIDPTLVTVKVAEASVKMGYRHSKLFLFDRMETPHIRYYLMPRK